MSLPAAAAGGVPLIGITTSEVRERALPEPRPQEDGRRPDLVLNRTYTDAVERAGGIPVVLGPLAPGGVERLLDHLAGVCLSGGPDLDPGTYGAEPHPELGQTEPDLDAFELALARAADARGLPLLGICRGAQALNVARGGTLHQHLPDLTDGSVAHRQSEIGTVPTHAVRIAPGSRLAEITGRAEIDINAFHHQGMDRLGEGLRAVAWATDGVTEAIEDERSTLYVGVQWHAETLVDRPEHLALFRELVCSARRYVAGDLVLTA